MPYEYETTQLLAPEFPWQVVAYLFANGIAGGAFILAALVIVFGSKQMKAGAHRAFYITFLLLPFCGAMLIGKLQVMSRFTNVLWHGRDGGFMLNLSSPMSVGAWVLSVFAIFGTISVIYAINKDGWIRWPWFKKLGSLATKLHEGTLGTVYLLAGSALAAWFVAYLGVLVTTSHTPAWNATPLIPVLWIVSAMTLGAAAVAITLVLSKNNQQYQALIQGINRVVTLMLILNVLVIIAFVLGLGQWSYAVNQGHFGIVLWGGVVVLGLLIPLLFRLKPSLLTSRAGLITSSALMLFGGLALRYVVMFGPQAIW